MSTGVDSYVGFAAETTWGTYVAPTSFLPARSAAFKFDQETLESDAVFTGAYLQDGALTADGPRKAGGRISYPLYRGTGLNVLFQLMLLSTTTGAGTVASKYTWLPGASSGSGKSISITIGKPRSDGVVEVLGYVGCKVSKWSINVPATGLATLDLDFVASTVAKQSAPTVTQSPPAIYSGVHGDFAVAGASRRWETLKMSGDNALDEKHYGGSLDIVEPLTTANRQIMTEATVAFDSATDLDVYLASPIEQAVGVTLTAGNDVLQFGGNAKLTNGADPDVAGKGRLQQNLQFKHYTDFPSLIGNGSAFLIQQWDASA